MEKSYKQLTVWQKSMDLVDEVYKFSKELPSSEKYNLVSQIRRSAVSIPSNIAEGYKRRNPGEYLHFLGIAEASAAELETQILIVNRNCGIYSPSIEGLLSEVQKMLFVLIKKLEAKTIALQP